MGRSRSGARSRSIRSSRRFGLNSRLLLRNVACLGRLFRRARHGVHPRERQRGNAQQARGDGTDGRPTMPPDCARLGWLRIVLPLHAAPPLDFLPQPFSLLNGQFRPPLCLQFRAELFQRLARLVNDSAQVGRRG